MCRQTPATKNHCVFADRHWLENKTFRTPHITELDTSKPKFYALDMFPYPRCVRRRVLLAEHLSHLPSQPRA